MTKAELRKLYKQERKIITPSQREKWTDMLLINFQKLQLPFIDCVHTYLAIDHHNEIDTTNIIRYLKFINPNLIVAVPKVNFETGEMEHYVYDDETRLSPNSFAILEPVQGKNVSITDIDLVITPLLAFDTKGYRVGYGKGFYDKFLHSCRSDVIKIGLSLFEPVESIDDVNDFDIPLDHCVTPQTVHTFQQLH